MIRLAFSSSYDNEPAGNRMALKPTSGLSGRQWSNHIAHMQDFLNWAFAFAVTLGGLVALCIIFWLIDKAQE